MLDLLIRNASVVAPSSTTTLDIGIALGKVAFLATPGTLVADADRVVDAKGRYAVPGGIDAHVHFNVAITPVMKAQSAKHGGRAAAHGGTTTFIEFALQHADGGLMQAIEAKHAEIRDDRPDIDYALHSFLTAQFPTSVLDEMPEAVASGVTSFKMLTTFSGNSAVGNMYTDDGRIWGVMERAAKLGAMTMVHCEDDCIIDFSVRRLYEEGRAQGENIYLARPNLCEEAAIARMLLLSRRSQCPLYIVHVSTHEGVEAIAEARGRRLPVFGEVLHNYLVFTSDDYHRPNGLTYHNYPPLKSANDRDSLWLGVKSSILDTVASDDFTVPLAGKLAGQTVDTVTGGNNSIETRMEVVYSEGVAKGKITINRMVELTATAPAQLFGIYPRKGIIAPESDADIVLIDPNARRTIRQSELHSDCDYSIWDGWEGDGRLTMTISRGRVLVEDGRWVGPEGGGEFIPCGLPSEPRVPVLSLT